MAPINQGAVMRRLATIRFTVPGGYLTVLFALAFSARAQVSSQLQLETIQIDGAAPVAFTFVDLGTGATNYTVEFRPGLEPGAAWRTETNAAVAAEGGGSYSVQISSPREQRGFYRVLGLGGSVGPIIIEFSTAAFQVVEGDTALPMLVLTEPFTGIVYYTVSGTAASGDYLALSGQVAVNGTTAAFPVSFTDNELIGQLKYLTLRLEAGPGYELGADTATTIVIEENDAEWQGTVIIDEAALGFALKVQQSNDVYLAHLKGSGKGLFPTNEHHTALSFTSEMFAATTASIPLPAQSTLLNAPLNLILVLNAANGQPSQSVGPDFIEGIATLITDVQGLSHLNTTNQGTFVLSRPPVAPSTNQVELVAVP